MSQTTPAASMPNPRQARSKERVRLILETSALLFEERGVASVTTNDIAAEANIPVGSIYDYFTDKNSLVLALAESYSRAIITLLETTKYDPRLATHEWEDIMYSLLRKWARCTETHKASTYSRFYRGDPKFRDSLYMQRQLLWAAFADIIRTKCPDCCTEETLLSVASTCISTMFAVLEASHDLYQQKDKTFARTELLHQCAVMVGTYLNVKVCHKL